MTANGEVQTREEATVFFKELDLFVTLMLLEETPAVLSLWKLCEDHGYTHHWISGQETTSHQKWKENQMPKIELFNHTFNHFSIIFITGLIPYLMSTDTPKIQHQKEVEAQVESFGGTRCMKPQKPETKIRMVNPKKHKERNRRNCTIGNRNPVGIWLMKVLQQSFWKTQSKEVKTLPKSSREFPTEPRAKVEPGSGKHRVFEGPRFWCLLEDGNNKGFLQKTCWCSRAQGDYCRSQIFGEENEFDVQSWCKIWQLSGYNPTRVKQNLPIRPRRTLWSTWNRQGSLKSFTLTIAWNLANLASNYPGIIVRQHHTDQKQMGLLKEQCAEWKKGPLRCYCSPVWVTNGGRILWNATAIFETFKISCLTGRHPMKDDSERLLTDKWRRLEQWANITLFLRKTNLDCINLVLKSCQGNSSVSHYSRRESGKETLWSETLKNWRRRTHLNSTREGSIQRKCQRQWEVKNSYSQ